MTRWERVTLQPTKKKAYRAPGLKVYGTLQALTAGASNKSSESASEDAKGIAEGHKRP